jgi:hypothetical protein
MVRRIVMWKLRHAGDAVRFKELLDECASLVPGIVEFEVAVRSDALPGNVDVVLNALLVDKAALDAYQNHPRHEAVSAEVADMREARHILDYEIDASPRRAQAERGSAAEQPRLISRARTIHSTDETSS